VSPATDQRYLQIVEAVDAEFERNRALHGDRIHCRPGCSDCCHHLFQITDIEAAWIASGFERLDADTRTRLTTRAIEYTEQRRKFVTSAGEAESWGRLPPPGTRLACPALENGVCSIYEFRPLMCHKFGMPLYNPAKPDRIFACELNFSDGEQIEDPDLITIQTEIHDHWKAVQADYTAAGGHRDSQPWTVARAILAAR
jgi:Fe-S-cluster containining protein